MASKKKIHPADAADREAVAGAVLFNVHLRVSPSVKINETAVCLSDAVKVADDIQRDYPTRKVLIYAITPTGASVPVPQDMRVAAREGDFDIQAKPAKPARVKVGKRAEALDAAKRGELPAAPDFSAPTHARFRKRLDALISMVGRGDVAALKAEHINPVSSSPKALAKFRDLAVIALEARAEATPNRPGDMAAEFAEEAGVSYSEALVSCNMD
jgi:hypothetical protein